VPNFKLLHEMVEFIHDYGVDELIEDGKNNCVARRRAVFNIHGSRAAHKMLETIHDYGVEKFIAELDGKKPIRASKNNVKKKIARKLKFKTEAL